MWQRRRRLRERRQLMRRLQQFKDGKKLQCMSLREMQLLLIQDPPHQLLPLLLLSLQEGIAGMT